MPQLTAPMIEEVVYGKHTLNLYGLQNASAAAPVSTTQLRGIQELNLDPNITEEDIFHQGGGDDSLKYPVTVEWLGNLQVLGGKISQIATLLGLTLGSSGQYALPHRGNNESIGFIERKIYRKDDSTLIGSQIIPDVKIGHIPIAGPLDQAQLNIPLIAAKSPYTLVGAVARYDVWAADGSTTTFTPSGTPVKIQEDLDAPGNELVTIYDFWVKHWASGDRVGTQQMSGYTITPATPVLTFDSAPASGKVGMLYAVATS